MRRWLADLLFGARLARSGGWGRNLLTAVGVGLGVALLLGAASVPHMLPARSDRSAARDDLPIQTGPVLAKADNTLLVAETDTAFRELPVVGRLVRAEGPRAPVPPGLSGLPGPGQMVVSPALRRLLASPGGALLRPRLPARIVGVIGDAGLTGPTELMYYAGDDRLSMTPPGPTHRIDHFGDRQPQHGLDPVLLLLVVVLFVVLLLPVAIFIGTAVRFGGEARDRRLAALRLVGADAAMARRIAAGEALLGALAGLLLGAGFFLAGRPLIGRITVRNVSLFFPSDVRPSLTLAVLIAVAVPVVAVAVSLLALRHTVIEPLGVVRQATAAPRRLWWRLLLPLVGLALLVPFLGRISQRGRPGPEAPVALGVVLLLVGVCTVLPWLTETVVRRISGGAVSWQLAIRRLQLQGGTSARVVSAVAVAVAGGIAVQMLFAGVTPAYTSPTGQDPARAQVEVSVNPVSGVAQADAAAAKLRATPGVRTVFDLLQVDVNYADTGAVLAVADCATLSQLITMPSCVDGDTFGVTDQTHGDMGAALPDPGQRVTLGDPPPTGQANLLPQWTIPAGIKPARTGRSPSGLTFAGLAATPGAIDAGLLRQPNMQAYLTLAAIDPDAVDQVRNTAAGIDPLSSVQELSSTSQAQDFTSIQHGLFIGVVATLLLIGASLLVGMLEQLRERRRVLAALVAFGTRRGTLSASVLWQSAVPMLLGLALAIVAGIGLGAVLLAMVGEPIQLDWKGIGAIAGAAGAVVLLVTLLSLPALWRLTRPDGLRTE